MQRYSLDWEACKVAFRILRMLWLINVTLLALTPARRAVARKSSVWLDESSVTPRTSLMVVLSHSDPFLNFIFRVLEIHNLSPFTFSPKSVALTRPAVPNLCGTGDRRSYENLMPGDVRRS